MLSGRGWGVQESGCLFRPCQQGNQVHIIYQRDMENWQDPSTGTTCSYPRNVVVQSIHYDFPGCLNARRVYTGTRIPQTQVLCNASSLLRGLVPGSCNTGSNLLCDDPADLSDSGGVSAPLIQRTSALNNIRVQVRATGTGF